MPVAPCAAGAGNARAAIPLLLALLLLLASIGCGRGRISRPGGRALAAGNHEITISHGGRARRYIAHIPARATGTLPVLLAFHGGGGNASGFQRYAELDEVSNREGFIVVYPNGTGPLPGRLLTWNAGDGCCGYALQNRVDDVGFAVAVIDDLSTRAAVDRRRVYATGHSNGAILSHRIAAERPDFVAAVAPVAGALDLTSFAPSRAVAVMQIHSVDDPRALYAGGPGPPFPGTTSRVTHQPVQRGLERWVASNGCAAGPDTTEERVAARGPRSPNPGHTATKIVWRSCRDGTEVAHWKLTVAGHGWPGNVPPAGGERLAGPQTTIVSAAEEVWSFVSRFSR
jgi:polyhydroxybutyrate depolymerase